MHTHTHTRTYTHTHTHTHAHTHEHNDVHTIIYTEGALSLLFKVVTRWTQSAAVVDDETLVSGAPCPHTTFTLSIYLSLP